MSLFSDLWQASFMPTLLHWHSDRIFYRPLDAEQIPLEICEALVGGEEVKRRREGEDLVSVTTRAVQFCCDPCDARFSGIANPQQNAVIEIKDNGKVSKYVIEKVTEGDSGMVICHLLLTNRIAKGSKHSLGE